MALSRAKIREILNNDSLDIEAKVSEIATHNSASLDAIKDELANAKLKADKYDEVKKELDDLKQGDWQKKYEDEHSAFDAFKNEQTAKETRGAKEKAYRDMLKEIGVADKRIDAVLRTTKIDDLELDKDGALKDKDNLVTKAKEEWSDFITESHVDGANVSKPPAGGGAKLTKDEIMKISDRSARRKAIAEHLDLFQ